MDDGMKLVYTQIVRPLTVLRFDGGTWTIYDNIRDAVTQNYPAIMNTANTNTLWTVDRARSQIWTAGAGVNVFDGETWTTYTVDDGLASNWVEAIDFRNPKQEQIMGCE